MPLTLNWNCPRNCTALAAFFECDANYTPGAIVGASGYALLLIGSGSAGFVNPANGRNSTGLGLDILNPAEWASIIYKFGIDASTSQQDFSSPAVWTITSWIRVDYSCVDPVSGLPVKTMSIKIPCPGGGAQCILGGETRSIVAGTVAKLWKSTPLGDCNGSFSLTPVGGAPPNPNNPTPPGGMQCLCASGGTPPYTYSVIQGILPGTQTLDPASGCIMGNPGLPGTSTMTFGVTDGSSGSTSITVPFASPPWPGIPPRIPVESLPVIPLPDPRRC